MTSVNATTARTVPSSHPDAEVFQSATQKSTPDVGAGETGVKRNTGTRADGGTTAINGNARPELLAQAIVPRQPLPKIVKSWAAKILPVLVPTTPRPGAKVPTTVPGAGGIGSSPTMISPIGNGRPSPVNTVFSPKTQVVSAPGVPQFNGKASDSVFAVVNAALSDAKMSQFALLSPGQQTLARTLLSAAMEGLKSTPGSSNYIAPNEFKTVVDLILTTSRNTKIPTTAPVVRTRPVPRQTIPGEVTLTPQQPTRPVRATPPQTPPDAPIVATAPQTPPAAPNVATAPQTPPAAPNVANAPQTPPPVPGTGTPQTPPAAGAATITVYPLSGPVPAWWADAIKGADGRPDPVMAKNMSQLITDVTEYRRQADTINIDRAVDPAKSTLTPRQEWNNWKAL